MSSLDYLPFLYQIVLAAGVGAVVVGASHFFGQRAKKNRIKDTAYECGLASPGLVHARVSVKFYLTAEATERDNRRKAELDAKGEPADLKQIHQAIETRDKSDENRAVGPLKPAKDAVTIDTTGLTIEQVVERLYRHVEERCPRNH